MILSEITGSRRPADSRFWGMDLTALINRTRSYAGNDSSSFDERLSILGRFEEVVLLAAIACGPKATAGAIQQRLEQRLGVQRTPTTMMTTLDRLSKKGLINSTMESTSTCKRGGRRRRLFDVTSDGRDSVSLSVNIITELAADAGLVDEGKSRAA